MKPNNMISSLEKLVESGSVDSDLFLVLIMEYLNAGQFQKAKEFSAKAVSINPQDARFYDLAAIACIQMELNLLAEFNVRKALSYSYDPFILRRLGLILALESRNAEALDVFIELNKSKPDAEIEQLIENQKQIVEQSKLKGAKLRVVTEINPNFPEALENLALVQIQLNDYENAIILLKRAIEINPVNSTLFSSLGKVFAITGDYNSAVTLFQKVLKFDPTDSSCFRYLGQILEIQNNFEEAESAYQRAALLES